MDDFIGPIAIVALVVVGLPWVVMHYMTEWKKNTSIKPEDERMIADMWRAARRMQDRIEALESILDDEAPGWPPKHPRRVTDMDEPHGRAEKKRSACSQRPIHAVPRPTAPPGASPDGPP